jgi:hypothetical protein
MSFGESAARAVVTVSAITLPRSIRERYREQWLADLRDAAEVGLNRGQIAVAALAFAVTTSHPWPERRVLEAADIQRRLRLALGLALGAALLGLSQYASIVPDRDLSDGINGATPSGPATIITGFLLVFAVIGPVLAVLLAALTRGIHRRVRVAVILLGIASCAPLAQYAVDRADNDWINPYVSPGSVAYVIAVFLVAAAIGMLYRSADRPSRSSRRSLVVAVIGGVVVAAAVEGGVALAAMFWSHRVPVVWVDTAVDGPARMSNPYYVQWLTGWHQGEATIASIFLWWAIAGVVLGALVVIVGIISHFQSRSVLALLATILFFAVVAEAGLLLFIDLSEMGTVDLSAVELSLVLGRCGLLLASLIGVVGIARRRKLSPGASSRERRASRRAAVQ